MSAVHARTLRAIDPNLTRKEIKAIVKQLVNEGKSLQDIPSMSKSLTAFKGLPKATRVAKLASVARFAGPALALAGTLLSAREGLACDGALGDRIEGLPAPMRILEQVGYDLVFGELMEDYILHPGAEAWANFWGDSFGVDSGTSAKERSLRDSIRQ